MMENREESFGYLRPDSDSVVKVKDINLGADGS